MNDPINKPNHYNWHPSGVQCVEISEHFTANISKAIDYLWRHNHKGTPIEDLKKAAWFIQREIKCMNKYLEDQLEPSLQPPEESVWVNDGA
jgi:Protein of unknwon function (DUF3310)